MTDRNKGLVSFSGNFEPQMAGPLDARNLTKTTSDLTSLTNWQANDGESYVYVGMSTIVYEDPIAENNGVYVLKALPITSIANWEKIGSNNTSGSVESINGRQGVVILDKSDVQLSNVDNTSDLDKPISTATQTALDLKADKTELTGKADQTDLEALSTEVDGKADQTAVDTALGLKADKTTVEALSTEVDGKADQTAVDTALGLKADQTALDTLSTEVDGKADQTAVDSALALKADKTELVGKANQTDLEALSTEVDGKADQTAVDSALALKADKTELAGKADQTALDALSTEVDGKADQTAVDTALGLKADLVDGKVPAAQLPSYVDDVIEVENFAALPTTGEASKIYITIDDNKTYRWGGTEYVEISSSLALGETASTAFRGDHGKIAYDTALANETAIDNLTTAMAGKANQTDVDSALALKADKTELAGKADQTAVDSALALKADKTDLDGKANQTDVDSALALKADKTELEAKADQTDVDSALALKADKTELEAKANTTDVNSALALKADQTDLEALSTEVDGKADQTAVDTALALKADQTAVDTALGLKADQTALDTLSTTVAGKQDTLTAGTNITIETVGEDLVISSIGGDTTYTNADEVVIEVGGVKVGQTFDNVSVQEVFDMMFYPELNPALTNPSSTFTENAPSLVEVGASTNITFTVNFNRGGISPAYGTSGFRSGAVNTYNYTGPELPTTVSSTESSNVQTISGFTIDTPSTVSWTSTVSYDAGEQPKTSKGNDFGTPLTSGTTQVNSVSITAVYPAFATTSSITDLTKQALSNGAYFAADMVGEDDTNKQTIEYALIGDNDLSGVEFFNTNSNKWEWLSSDRTKSITNFDYSEITKTLPTGDVTYRRYVNNSSKVGARQMRFYI